MQPRAVSSATTARKPSQRRRLAHGGQGRKLPRPLAAGRGTPAPTATTAQPAKRAKEGRRMTARSAGRREKRKIKPKAVGLNWTERRRERGLSAIKRRRENGIRKRQRTRKEAAGKRGEKALPVAARCPPAASSQTAATPAEATQTAAARQIRTVCLPGPCSSRSSLWRTDRIT
jgi:hypothetical protein